MNARQLEVFRAIMRSGSLTAAATLLNVSQPALSKVLRHFEDQLGYRLFERTGGRLQPTAEAELLFADADRVFREIETVRDLAVRIRERDVGLLRIGAGLPQTFAVIAEALRTFGERHPGVKVILRTLTAQDLTDRILVGEVDLGVTLSPIRLPQLTTELVAATQMVVVLPEGHALADRPWLEPADLAGHRLISYSSDVEVGPSLDAAFEAGGHPRRIAIEITQSIAALPLVRAGLGIAVLDGMLPWQTFGGVVVRPFRPTVMMSLNLVMSGARPISRTAKAFAADLHAAADRLGLTAR